MAMALFETDENFLVARLADLQPYAAAGAEVPAGKAHECAHGRVLRVKAQVVGERSTFRHDSSSSKTICGPHKY
jgi:hypothetical protein